MKKVKRSKHVKFQYGNLIKFVLKSLFISAIATFAWYFFWQGIHYNHEMKSDAEIMSSGTINVLIVLYGLIYAFIINKVWTQWNELKHAIKTGDKNTFEKYCEERIPTALHFLIIFLAILIFGGLFLHPFASFINGLYSIFSTSLALVVCYEVAKDLDDPFVGIFNLDVPPDWINHK